MSKQTVRFNLFTLKTNTERLENALMMFLHLTHMDKVQFKVIKP